MKFTWTGSTGGRVCALIASMMLLLLLGTGCGTSTGMGSPGASLTTQQCGSVHAFRSRVTSMDQSMARGVEDCFWQAFQQCQPATMSYTQSDATSGTVHTFSLENQNGRCLVTDSARPFTTHMSQPAVLSTCAGIQKRADGLRVLSCGKLGNILIPAVGA
jgi:hypothetical protein